MDDESLKAASVSGHGDKTAGGGRRLIISRHQVYYCQRARLSVHQAARLMRKPNEPNQPIIKHQTSNITKKQPRSSAILSLRDKSKTETCFHAFFLKNHIPRDV